MNFNVEFYNHICVLFALMFGFTCFKIANCKPFKADGEDWSWSKLLIGTGRHLIIITGTMVVFAVSCACGTDLMLIQIGETQVTIQSAIDITTLVILAVYGTKYIKNLAEYAGVTKRMPIAEEALPAVANVSILTDEQAADTLEKVKG